VNPLEKLQNTMKQLGTSLNGNEKLVSSIKEDLGRAYGNDHRYCRDFQIRVRTEKDSAYGYMWEANELESGATIKFSVIAEPDILFKMTLGPDAHCCGICQLQGFKIGRCLEGRTDVIHGIIDFCIKAYRDSGYYCDRVVMTMVERRLNLGNTSESRYDLLTPIKPIENPDIVFRPVWDWAHKQRRVQDMLMMNPNTGRVLHHMEVVVNK
jgi:hypothetical protein